MRFFSFFLVALISLGAGRAAADDNEQARLYTKRALSAYGLDHFAEAAELYEKAFGLLPDPALLYDAAQAHRMAGNRPRALELYQSYLRLFGDGAKNRGEVERKVAELKKELAAAPPAPAPTPTPRSTDGPPSGIFTRAPALRVAQPRYEGPCPATVSMAPSVFSNNAEPVTIYYRFQRSDGGQGKEQSLALDGPGEHPLPPFLWRVSGAPGRKLDAWVQLKVLRPTPYLSPQEHFTVECR